MQRTPDLRRARIRFAAIFAVVGGALLTLYSFPYAEHGFHEDLFAWYLAAYARAAGAVIHLTDPTVQIAGPARRQLDGRSGQFAHDRKRCGLHLDHSDFGRSVARRCWRWIIAACE